jgi:hypothetical protein
MRGSPAMRRRRLAAIREQLSRRSVVEYREADLDGGSRVIVVLSDGTARPATSDERAEWAAAAPRETWDFIIGPDRIARPVIIPTALRITRAPRTSTPREHRSQSTTSRRARTTSALSAADPSSSRGRLSATALGHFQAETTRLAFRLALLGIGGAR